MNFIRIICEIIVNLVIEYTLYFIMFILMLFYGLIWLILRITDKGEKT